MMLRTIFFVGVLTGVFFYWDINQNKSIYCKISVKKVLNIKIKKIKFCFFLSESSSERTWQVWSAGAYA
jgi:hypothetical protein